MSRLRHLPIQDRFRHSCFEWRITELDLSDTLERYVVHGCRPGSFYTAMLANDFVGMSGHSHPDNSWAEMTAVARWLVNVPPQECFGSYEKVQAWVAMSQAERTKLCEESGLVLTAWEILSTKELA